MLDIKEKFERDGYAIIEDFLTPEETDRLKQCGEELIENTSDIERRVVFSSTKKSHELEKYFMESSNKISYFFEESALNEDGSLAVDPKLALNKVGHALHWLHPEFRKVSFCERVKETAFQLGYKKPAICQSMYIYKNPGTGGEVIPHQDATYLYNEPLKLFGLWFALDDATLENGCLWFAPGSHRSGVHRRFIRSQENPDKMEYTAPQPNYPTSNFRAEPIKKGSCILIHGLVVHKSDANKSKKSRHAYTFHVIDVEGTTYKEENWLQLPKGESFPELYINN